MTCTCSGHANEPNPCPVCQRESREWEAVMNGDRDEALGAWLRENYRQVTYGLRAIEQFVESRLEDAVP